MRCAQVLRSTAVFVVEGKRFDSCQYHTQQQHTGVGHILLYLCTQRPRTAVRIISYVRTGFGLRVENETVLICFLAFRKRGEIRGAVNCEELPSGVVPRVRSLHSVRARARCQDQSALVQPLAVEISRRHHGFAIADHIRCVLRRHHRREIQTSASKRAGSASSTAKGSLCDCTSSAQHSQYTAGWFFNSSRRDQRQKGWPGIRGFRSRAVSAKSDA